MLWGGKSGVSGAFDYLHADGMAAVSHKGRRFPIIDRRRGKTAGHNRVEDLSIGP
ncbi:hypothetical protein GCM10009780_12920 [Actinomadura alba]